MARTRQEQLDVTCTAGCETVYELSLSVPPANRPDHTEVVLRQLHRKGWRGDAPNKLLCPPCVKETPKQGR